MFWKNSRINSEEYEKLSMKVVELHAMIHKLSSEIRIVQSDNANLRGQFNRKLLGIKKEEQTEEIQEQKDINNQVILPYDGNIFKLNR